MVTRKTIGMVLGEPEWEAFDRLCIRNGLSQTKMLSIAVHEFLASAKNRQIVMPVEILKTFAEDSRTRKINLAKAAERAKK